MTWTIDQSGTTSTLTIGASAQLGTNSTTNATYVLKFNASNLALGDVLEARIFTQDLSSGSLVQVWKASFSNSQINPLKLSPPVSSDIALACYLTQVAGTGRTFTWEILRI
jgi:hypothetical protein